MPRASGRWNTAERMAPIRSPRLSSKRSTREAHVLFSVFTLDNPNAADKRKAVHGEHVAHLKKAKDYGVTITVGGPLLSDDGTASIGSLMVLEAPDRASAEKF